MSSTPRGIGATQSISLSPPLICTKEIYTESKMRISTFSLKLSTTMNQWTFMLASTKQMTTIAMWIR